MTNTYPNPSQLWGMQPHVFNEWRATHDLQKLFEFLKELFPSFETWLQGLPFGMDVVLRIVPTGDLFKGDKKKVVFKRNADIPGVSVIECRDGTPEETKLWWGHRHQEIDILGEFEPYFKWAKKTLGRKRFFIWDKMNRQVSDAFLYGSWSGLNEDGCVTQAHLFRSFVALKLGQIEIDRLVAIGARNLDF